MMASVVKFYLNICSRQWSSKTPEIQVHTSTPKPTYPYAYPHEIMHVLINPHNTSIHEQKQQQQKVSINPLYIKESSNLKDSKSQ